MRGLFFACDKLRKTKGGQPMASIETVTIDRDGQPVIINASKYDPALHTIYGAEPVRSDEDEEKARIRADLKELGIEVGGNTKLETLRARLEKALNEKGGD
jgi:hypothetical protein